MGKIIVAALGAVLTCAALSAAPALAAPDRLPRAGNATTALRAQNAMLRERMGQIQLDLLIADVIARRDMRAVAADRRAGLAVPQVIAYRK